MILLFSELDTIDEKLKKLLNQEDIDSAEVHYWLHQRDQALKKIVDTYPTIGRECQNTDANLKQAWKARIALTEHILKLMNNVTQSLGKDAKKYRYGTKSIEKYKQFSQ
ncbi:hypothetical protein N9R79_08510 [Vibrio sp.]|nr:hypothetical protein [Vibrio sp.]